MYYIVVANTLRPLFIHSSFYSVWVEAQLVIFFPLNFYSFNITIDLYYSMMLFFLLVFHGTILWEWLREERYLHEDNMKKADKFFVIFFYSYILYISAVFLHSVKMLQNSMQTHQMMNSVNQMMEEDGKMRESSKRRQKIFKCVRLKKSSMKEEKILKKLKAPHSSSSIMLPCLRDNTGA